jgi:toxin ParE1/3/4
MQARWKTPAAQDLEEIALHIEMDNEPAARSVARTLFDTANSLEHLPSRGRVGRIVGIRDLVVPNSPFTIVYRATKAMVETLHILHGARNWPGEQ